MIERISVRTTRKGLHELTNRLDEAVVRSGMDEGLCTIFIQHTSASLVIQENADPSARADLEAWMERHVPEDDRAFTHTAEGPDDMPAHIKAALTATSLSIPVTRGRLALGTWQGVFVWEHRHRGSERRLIVHIGR